MRTFVSKIIGFGVTGLIAMSQPFVSADIPASMADAKKESQENQAKLGEGLKTLLTQHGTYFNQTVVTVFSNASPDAIIAVNALLLQNVQEIGSVFGELYGSKAGNELGNLLSQQVVIGSSYINAVKAGELVLAQQHLMEWIEQGYATVDFLHGLNKHISEKGTRALFKEFIQNEADLTVVYSQQDFVKATQLFDQSLTNLRDLSDVIAKALAK